MRVFVVGHCPHLTRYKMSVNYASGLSEYSHKGKCGAAELFDESQQVETKVRLLTEWIQAGRRVVVHTGAGISTSAGIPDFRGPKGVWTLEEKGQSPAIDITFEDAKPTFTHMALGALEEAGYVVHVVTQNVDGLHIRSGFPRDKLSILHGDMFVEECEQCGMQYVRKCQVCTVGKKLTGNACTQMKRRGKCRGKLRDTVLDWEDALPEIDLQSAEQTAREAAVNLVLGSSLQIVPAGNLPLAGKKNGGKLVIVNLQQTKHDKKADLIIRGYVDDVMRQLCDQLGVAVSEYKMPVPRLRSSTGNAHSLTKRRRVTLDGWLSDSMPGADASGIAIPAADLDQFKSEPELVKKTFQSIAKNAEPDDPVVPGGDGCRQSKRSRLSS